MKGGGSRGKGHTIEAIGTSNSGKPYPHLDPKGKGERWMSLEPREGLEEESHSVVDAIPEQCGHWQNHREWRQSTGGTNSLTALLLLCLLPPSSLLKMPPISQTHPVTEGKGAWGVVL